VTAKLQTYLGRVVRDIGRKIAGNDALQEVFAKQMNLAGPCAAKTAASAGRKSIPGRPRSGMHGRPNCMGVGDAV
jgi:hypothetical protein